MEQSEKQETSLQELNELIAGLEKFSDKTSTFEDVISLLKTAKAQKQRAIKIREMLEWEYF